MSQSTDSENNGQQKLCLQYPCLKKLQQEDLKNQIKLDSECRYGHRRAKRFCYCCGGTTNYYIYGKLCNRFCLKVRYIIHTIQFTNIVQHIITVTLAN